jgi:glyoxylate carboligase
MAATVEPQRKARGAEILLEILQSEGARFIFGNPGTTELPLIDALVVNPDLRYVWGLQESTVVGMADGYAQASLPQGKFYGRSPTASYWWMRRDAQSFLHSRCTVVGAGSPV